MACCGLFNPAGAAPPSAPATYSAGLPAIHNFDPRDYGAAAQNWSLAQDRQGVIYVGNLEGVVLAFDGAHWQRITVPNRAAVRSLALAADGRIYVGTVGNLGYLQSDASGQLVFVSLLDKVPSADRDFTDVWSIRATTDGVFFTTATRLFRYHDGVITAFKPETSFHLSFMVDDALYISETNVGLQHWDGRQFTLMPGGEHFANQRIYAVLPWRGPGAQPGDLLIGTRNDGWFIGHQGHFRRWPTAADVAIRQGLLYGATWLADGRLAASTLRGGLFVLDAQGHLLRNLTRASGLTTNMLLALMVDHQGGLWIAADNGITRIDINSALTHFDDRSGLPSGVSTLQHHDGTLYAGTSEGLYRLVRGSNAHFEPVPRLPGQIWGLASFDGELLVATHGGVFAIPDTGGPPRQLSASPPTGHTTVALALQPATDDPSRLFVGYGDGVGTLHKVQGHWLDEGRIAGVNEEVRRVQPDADGHLWLTLWVDGAIRLTLPPQWRGPADPRPVKVEHFGADAGLPAEPSDVAMVDGQLRFTTSHGIYRFDAASRRFAPDPQFAGLFPGGPQRVDVLQQGRSGELWINAVTDANGTKQTGRAVREHGHWRWLVTPLQPLAGIDIATFLDDADGPVWIGSDKGLFRYQSTRDTEPRPPSPTLLRTALVQNGNVLNTLHPGATPARIAYDHNAVRFEFALPGYDHFDTNEYQVWLDGLDAGWSPWSTNAYRDYTNIPAGLYRFHVRARNVYKQPAAEATFDFRILPPWYRTLWAWLAWLLLATALVVLLIRWRSATLRARNRALAALVEERTAELAEANRALARQAITDPLTGLKNRRYLREHIERDLVLARQGGGGAARHGERAIDTRLLFLMVDIDHFKRVNDTWGHGAGDLVLQQLRDILLAEIREFDIPVRRGGEEFLIVAHVIPADDISSLAERIRAGVAAHAFDLGNGQRGQITCSIGFTCYPFFAAAPDQLSWEQVVNLADVCLYAAKHGGRNGWVGIAPLDAPLTESALDTLDALHASIARFPEPGPLPLLAAWAPLSGTS